MNKRDIMLAGAGVLVGYLLARYYIVNKANAQSTKSEYELQVEKAKQIKIDECKKSVEDFMATAQFKSDVDLDKIKKDKFDACMKAGGIK